MNELTKALEEFVNQRNGSGLIPVTVTAINTDEFVFDAKDGEGNEFFDIRTNAIPGLSGLIALPQVGASALIIDLGNQGQDYVLLQAGQLSEVRIHMADNTAIYANAQRLDLGSNLEPAVRGSQLNTNLSSLINQIDTLMTLLQTFASSQSAATVGVLAPLNPAYVAIAAQIPNVRGQLSIITQQLPTHLSNSIRIGS